MLLARSIVQPATGCAFLTRARRKVEAMADGGAPAAVQHAQKVQRLMSSDGKHHIAYCHSRGKAPGIMFLSGFGSRMDGEKASAVFAAAAAEQREVVRFDYRGHGMSDGSFLDHCLSDWIDDAIRVLDTVAEAPKMVLIGSSMGGYISLHLGLLRPNRVAGILGIATAVDFLERTYQGLGEEQRRKLEEESQCVLTTPKTGYNYVVTAKLLEDGRKHVLLPEASSHIELECPIRLLHGCDDDVVPFQSSLDLSSQVTTSNVVVSLIKDGDHRLSRPSDMMLMMRCMEELCTLNR